MRELLRNLIGFFRFTIQLACRLSSTILALPKSPPSSEGQANEASASQCSEVEVQNLGFDFTRRGARLFAQDLGLSHDLFSPPTATRTFHLSLKPHKPCNGAYKLPCLPTCILKASSARTHDTCRTYPKSSPHPSSPL